MGKMIKDLFLTELFGYDCYTSNKLNLNKIKKTQRPFFLTIKSRNKLNIKIDKNIRISLMSKQINFKKKVVKTENNLLNCRKANYSDKKNILKIAQNSPSVSRFLIDKTISKKFKKNYKKEWILNYFRRKRGDNLLLAFLNKTIFGFILLIKKKNEVIIDQIVVDKKYVKKKVGTSLINYLSKLYFNNGKLTIKAGTSIDNRVAKKFYLKNGFKKFDTYFIYHLKFV